MPIDWKWMSNGGLLLDGTGDIAGVDDPIASAIDMVSTRLKAALRGWRLYPIGADLERFIGNAITQELETSVSRQVMSSLSYQYLPSGTFQVKTLATAGAVTVYVYLNQQMIVSATVDPTNGTVTVQTVSN